MKRSLVQLSELEGLEIKEVKQLENRDRDRPDFDNRYLKILYFFWKEGIISTLRKYYAHKQEQVRYLTILLVTHSGETYVNVSVQSQTDPSRFVISNEFFPYSKIKYNSIQENIEHYLDAFNQLSGKAHYEILGVKTDSPLHFALKERTYNETFEQGLFVYGLGGYVRMFIMHHFKGLEKIACVDYRATVSSAFQEKYSFRYGFLISEDSFPVLKQTRYPVAIIATYHSDHARLAEAIYHANPNTQIFLEKPPAVTLEDLEKLIVLFRKGASIEVGFNRRYIPWSSVVKKQLEGKVPIITCTVKEVVISPNHWYFWENQGTRVTGNVVHWFDLANYWIQSEPVEINVMAGPENIESSAISVLYRNGSVLNITASDTGNSMRGVQERMEIRFDNETIFIDDFNSLLHIRRSGVRRVRRKIRRTKGHSRMYRDFSKKLGGGSTWNYPLKDLINTSVVTYYASKMLKEGTRNLHIGEIIDQYHAMDTKN